MSENLYCWKRKKDLRSCLFLLFLKCMQIYVMQMYVCKCLKCMFIETSFNNIERILLSKKAIIDMSKPSFL